MSDPRSRNDRPTRTASRYAAIGMGLVGLVGVAIATTLFFWARTEQDLRTDLESYHLRSVSLASGLAADIAGLQIELNKLGASEVAPDDVAIQMGVGLASARVASEQLAALRPQVESPLMRAVVARLDRYASLIERSRRIGGELDLDTTHASLSSLALAVDQLRRMHEIEAGAHLAEMTGGATRSNGTVALIILFFIAGVASIGFRILALLRRALAREDELRASLERARTRQLRAVKMESLAQLAGGVAHDFNNLLTVMLGHTEHIDQSLDPESPLLPETKGIEHAISLAAALTAQLLSFSRSEPGESRVIDLNELVRGMELLLSRLLGRRCTLLTALSPDLDSVRANPREIERVLVNLISNAGDAMPTGGTVTIETINIQPKRADPDDARDDGEEHDFVRLSVCDTGSGMAEEIRDRIFEPFFTTKAEGAGTGVGLSTVDSLVAKAGGWVEAESELEIGTRIDVYLPRYGAGPGDDLAPAHSNDEPSSETILVVEDEPSVRSNSARMLRQAGYTVLECADGAAALELCREYLERIDLIFTDVIMPGMTGPELIEQAKFLRPEARVLFASGYSGAELPAGSQLLEKPFRRQDLLGRVRSIIHASGESGHWTARSWSPPLDDGASASRSLAR